MKNSPIEWTGDTDNIIVVEGGGWWCRMISPGCANCYAARLNRNTFYGGNHLPYTGQPPKLLLRRDIIDGWQRQTRPRKHFVASMTDVFGEWVEREWIFYFLDGMAAAPLQTFQVLTKRPAVAAREIAAWLDARGRFDLPPNIWIGTSVEDQTRAQERIFHLLQIRAAVRFLSCEPLLGPLNLVQGYRDPDPEDSGWKNPLTGYGMCDGMNEPTLGSRIDWVSCGGESGPGARPMHPAWARSLRDQCEAAGVAFFFKQWGDWKPADDIDGPITRLVFPAGVPSGPNNPDWHNWPDGWKSARVGKKAAGRLLDGREHNQFPQLITA